MHIPNDPAIPLLKFCSSEITAWEHEKLTCKNYHRIINNCKIWKTSKCSSIREGALKLWNSHKMEYQAGINKYRCLYWTWRDTQDRLLGKNISCKKKLNICVYIYTADQYRQGKSIFVLSIYECNTYVCIQYICIYSISWSLIFNFLIYFYINLDRYCRYRVYRLEIE